MIKEALLQKIKDSKVQCLTCERRCEIDEGQTGFCKTRKNIAGKLYTLVYGEIASISANPIEKKPLYHFYPGSFALTVGTWSCNFTCPWCQNFRISKAPENIGKGKFFSPENFIELMKKYKCKGTSFSFNEPTLLFEYSLEVFHLAKKEGFYNTYVTNGYMTEEALKTLIHHGLDAMNIDIKGNAQFVRKYCGADVEKIWRNAVIALQNNVWIEITTLIIPGLNDDEKTLREFAKRIKNELGENIPWHLNAYYPAYDFSWKTYIPPTSIETLERGYEIAMEEGLNYVYIGNIPNHPGQNTYCPKCKRILIERDELRLKEYYLDSEEKCYNCKEKIPVIN
uniref:AmmeMemoRadiSam system radical SAM enzyme n=1 Tax=Thermodesulfovibrio aggregans TaxID=86166 RepID=A0A7C4EKZ9_9BACT